MQQAKVSSDETPRDESLNRPKLAGAPGSSDEQELENQHDNEHGHIEPFDLIRIASNSDRSRNGVVSRLGTVSAGQPDRHRRRPVWRMADLS